MASQIPNELYHQPPETPTTKRPRKQKWILAILLISAIVGTSIGAYVIYKQHIDNESTQVLHQIQQSGTFAMNLQLHPSMTIQLQQGHISVYAKSRTATDGSILLDGTLSYLQDGLMHNYTLINNKGYYSIQEQKTGKTISVSCIPKDQIPPFHKLNQIIRNGRVIDDISGSSTSCAKGKLVEIMFAGEPYVLCLDQNKKIQKLIGEDLETFIEYGSKKVENDSFMFQIPRDPETNQLLECDQVETESKEIENRSLLESTKHLSKLWYDALFERRRLSTMKMEARTCKTAKRPCLFIHGAGEHQDGSPTNSYKDYWGDIHKNAHCCSQVKFIRMNTVYNTWYDSKLHDKVCNLALELSGSSTTNKIKNVVLITHSMGNLILASALAKGKCSIESSSTWVALQGPLLGSMSSDFIHDKCKGNGVIDKVLKVIAKWIGYCPVTTTYKSLVFKSGTYSNPSLKHEYNQAIEEYQQHVSGALCGISSFGLNTLMSAPMKLIGSLSGHASSKNDGVVDSGSCMSSLNQKFSDHYDSKFYKPSVNHADGTFRNGDGWYGSHRKPIKWFRNLL